VYAQRKPYLGEPDGDDHVRAVQQRGHGHLGRPDRVRVVPDAVDQYWQDLPQGMVPGRRKNLSVVYNA